MNTISFQLTIISILYFLPLFVFRHFSFHFCVCVCETYNCLIYLFPDKLYVYSSSIHEISSIRIINQQKRKKKKHKKQVCLTILIIEHSHTHTHTHFILILWRLFSFFIIIFLSLNLEIVKSGFFLSRLVSSMLTHYHYHHPFHSLKS